MAQQAGFASGRPAWPGVYKQRTAVSKRIKGFRVYSALICSNNCRFRADSRGLFRKPASRRGVRWHLQASLAGGVLAGFPGGRCVWRALGQVNLLREITGKRRLSMEGTLASWASVSPFAPNSHKRGESHTHTHVLCVTMKIS